MKIKILILTIFISSFSLFTIAQSGSQQGDKELLDAMKVFSKYNGQIFIEDSVILNEKGKIQEIYYKMISSPEGNGFRNTIQCKALFKRNAQISFNDPLFEKENFFSMKGTWNYKGNPGLRSFSNVVGFGIGYNEQVEITSLKSGYRKTGGRFEKKVVNISYQENGTHVQFKEKIVFAKGKDKKKLKEKGSFLSKTKEYKEFQNDGQDFFKYNQLIYSSNIKDQRVMSEKYEVYCYKKEGDKFTIVKNKNDANGNLKKRTSYYYKNYSNIGSVSFDNIGNKTDSTYYEYNNESDFVTLKAIYKINSSKIIPDMKWEYSYDTILKEGATVNVPGKYNYTQNHIRTTYDENGNPKYQDSSKNTKRRYFKNGTWSEWQQQGY